MGACVYVFEGVREREEGGGRKIKGRNTDRYKWGDDSIVLSLPKAKKALLLTKKRSERKKKVCVCVWLVGGGGKSTSFRKHWNLSETCITHGWVTSQDYFN